MKSHVGSLRRLIMLTDFSPDLSGGKKDHRQITNIGNERGDITLEIKMIWVILKNILPITLTTYRRWENSMNYQTNKA